MSAGGFGIVVERSKSRENLGTLIRGAENFGAAFVATVGKRYEREPSDCLASWRRVPVFHYRTWAEWREATAFAWVPVAVEIVEGATPLPAFVHPPCAVYLLGPEDGSLSAEALCGARTVVIPSTRCLNVAVAGSVVMYDRIAKLGR